VEAIAAGWPDDPTTLPLLHDRARNDLGQYGNVRIESLQALTILSPTLEAGAIARELLGHHLLDFNRRRVQRLIAIAWPEDAAEPPD
jgi:hypothetical protein